VAGAKRETTNSKDVCRIEWDYTVLLPAPSFRIGIKERSSARTEAFLGE